MLRLDHLRPSARDALAANGLRSQRDLSVRRGLAAHVKLARRAATQGKVSLVDCGPAKAVATTACLRTQDRHSRTADRRSRCCH